MLAKSCIASRPRERGIFHVNCTVSSAVSLKDLKNEVYFKRSALEMSSFVQGSKKAVYFGFLIIASDGNHFTTRAEIIFFGELSSAQISFVTWHVQIVNLKIAIIQTHYHFHHSI